MTHQIENFSLRIERQFEKNIKNFITDNARDFCNTETHEFFAGMRHYSCNFMCIYTSAKRVSRKKKIGIIEVKGRTVLLRSNAHKFLWEEGMITATRL